MQNAETTWTGDSDDESPLRVILAVTGSVAAIKAPDVCRGIISAGGSSSFAVGGGGRRGGGGVRLCIIATTAGLHFLRHLESPGDLLEEAVVGVPQAPPVAAPNTMVANGNHDDRPNDRGAERKAIFAGARRRLRLDPRTLPRETNLVFVPVFTDADEWALWQRRGDPVLHIELAQWADVVVIAPCCANTLAKLALGLCDDLLTCVLRARPKDRRATADGPPPSSLAPRLLPRLVLAPAMNSQMWVHPATSEHLAALRQHYGSGGGGVVVATPVSKTLMCGDVGIGAMSDPDTIARCVFSPAFVASRM